MGQEDNRLRVVKNAQGLITNADSFYQYRLLQKCLLKHMPMTRIGELR